jgi:hypothetical protein
MQGLSIHNLLWFVDKSRCKQACYGDSAKVKLLTKERIWVKKPCQLSAETLKNERYNPQAGTRQSVGPQS